MHLHGSIQGRSTCHLLVHQPGHLYPVAATVRALRSPAAVEEVAASESDRAAHQTYSFIHAIGFKQLLQHFVEALGRILTAIQQFLYRL